MKFVLIIVASFAGTGATNVEFDTLARCEAAKAALTEAWNAERRLGAVLFATCLPKQ